MTNSKPIIHLICGPIGAGKTTFAAGHAKNIHGPVFSVDEWMVSLFAKDMPMPMDWSWIAERATRCEERILDTALRLVPLGMPCVLDIGLLRADRRGQVALDIRSKGHKPQFHFLDVPAEERWRRIEHRNAQRNETFHMEVSREMFDFIETIWEPPSVGELKALGG